MTQTTVPSPLRPLPRPLPQLGEVRIGDEERSRTCEELSVHYAAGRLDPAELDERMTLAVQARTQSDLARLVADLPRVAARVDDAGHPGQTVHPGRAATPHPSTASGRMLAQAFFGMISFCALGCTLLLLLGVSATDSAGLVWLAAFGAAVASSGITYFAGMLHDRQSAARR